MNEETREDAIVRMAKVFEKIIEDEIGRGLVATMIECDEKRDALKREISKLDGIDKEAENKLINKFNITYVDWMNMSIAIRMEGIKKILEERRINRFVV